MDIKEEYHLTTRPPTGMPPPEEEFRGPCSNLAPWVENDYDTRLLHSSLAFPFLKELADHGDARAMEKFKEEVFARLCSGYPPVLSYLHEMNYVLVEKALFEGKIKEIMTLLLIPHGAIDVFILQGIYASSHISMKCSKGSVH